MFHNAVADPGFVARCGVTDFAFAGGMNNDYAVSARHGLVVDDDVVIRMATDGIEPDPEQVESSLPQIPQSIPRWLQNESYRQPKDVELTLQVSGDRAYRSKYFFASLLVLLTAWRMKVALVKAWIVHFCRLTSAAAFRIAFVVQSAVCALN